MIIIYIIILTKRVLKSNLSCTWILRYSIDAVDAALKISDHSAKSPTPELKDAKKTQKIENAKSNLFC